MQLEYTPKFGKTSILLGLYIRTSRR